MGLDCGLYDSPETAEREAGAKATAAGAAARAARAATAADPVFMVAVGGLQNKEMRERRRESSAQSSASLVGCTIPTHNWGSTQDFLRWFACQVEG